MTQLNSRRFSKALKARFPLGEFVRANRQKRRERFLLVRGEFFRQPILTNHVAGFLFSLCVAQTNSPSGKRA